MTDHKQARVFRAPNAAALHDGSWVRAETFRQVDLPDLSREKVSRLVSKWKREGLLPRGARLSANLELHRLGDLRAAMRAETLDRTHDAAAEAKIQRLNDSRAKPRSLLGRQ